MIRLLIIIPAFNESATIQKVVGSISNDFSGISEVSVLVIDDGSGDNTGALALKTGAIVLAHSKNLGLGAALQTGLTFALEHKFDIVVNIDADGQFDVADIKKLVEPILKDEADFVSASRFKDSTLTPKMPFFKRWGNHAMSSIVSMLTRNHFYDVSCGFRAYSREALLRLMLRGEFTYTQEMFLIFSFKKLRIQEIPVAVRGEREYGKSRVASNMFSYAFKTLSIIYRCFRDYKPSILFNSLSGVLFTMASILGSFFISHRFFSGRFSPHIWSGFLAGFFFTISFVVFLFGQIASMIDRNRFYQEEIIYMLRKRY